MSWLKIDDGLFVHPKWLRTPATARALWITALSYCGKMNTDGYVDSALLPLLGGSVEDAEALTSSGLWDAVGGGYCFHDFEEYNRTTQQAEVLSETRAEAGRAGAAVRWGNTTKTEVRQRHGNSIAKNSKLMAKNAPEPEPEPIGSKEPTRSRSPLPPDAPPIGKNYAEGDGAPGLGGPPTVPRTYAEGMPLPLLIQNAIQAKGTEASDWERELRLELQFANIAGSAEAYMARILKRWEREGLPQRTRPETDHIAATLAPPRILTESDRAGIRAAFSRPSTPSRTVRIAN